MRLQVLYIRAICLFTFLFLLGLPYGAQADTYRFFSSNNGLAPFYWSDEQNTPKGIIPDILSGIEDLKLEFVRTPRKRIDIFIQEDMLDLAMLHPNYTEQDNLLIFVPLGFSQKNVLFKRTDFPSSVSDIEDLRDTSVCARFGYLYINMSHRWHDQNIRREDIRSNETVLEMLSRERCDYAIGTSISFNYLIKEKAFQNITESPIVVNEVPRYLAVSKRFPELATRIRKHVEHIQETGELEAILKKYAP